MVSRAGGGVEMGITVVNHVKAPHPADFVQQHMNQVLCHQFEDEQGDDEFNPQGKREEMQQAELRFIQPDKYARRSDSKNCVDHHGGGEKHQVHFYMSPFIIRKPEERKRCFKNPAKGQANEDPGGTLPDGHIFEKLEERFHRYFALIYNFPRKQGTGTVVERLLGERLKNQRHDN